MRSDSHKVCFRAVFIYSKGYKRQLLMSWRDIATLTTFIKKTVKQEVTIINTNVGIDIYYFSRRDMKDFISKAFLLLHTIKGKTDTDFKIVSLQSSQEIRQYLYFAYLHWSKMPLLLKSYVKSFVIQLTRDFMPNVKINSLLFSIWYKNLKRVQREQGSHYNKKGELLINTLQELYLNQNYNESEKLCIKQALHESHHN